MLHKAVDPPRAPDSLPKYIAEGIPKQDDSTIEDLREYSQTVLCAEASGRPTMVSLKTS